MQYNLIAIMVTALVSLLGASADFCSQGSTELEGNWFCQPVNAIRYSNVGTPGSYNQVTEMAADGTCSSVPRAFSGPISPLDEEISIHFRGPLQLKQFAAYVPSGSVGNINENSPAHVRRYYHNHQDSHKQTKADWKDFQEQKRQEVTATIDGQVVSWANNWFGDAASTKLTPASTFQVSSDLIVTATIDGQVVTFANDWFGESASTTPPPIHFSTESTQVNIAEVTTEELTVPTSTSQPATAALTTSSPEDTIALYERIGYYDSESQFLDGLTFLGNHGGEQSGVCDDIFGASLSYVNSCGTSGASSPQVLADTVIPSDAEIIVMTSRECTDGECGYVRPGAITYHGFDGAAKIFLIEFIMPIEKEKDFDGDMPAIWVLNANIPRTLQYGDSECSCWESGCGEFDIVETLVGGSTYLKSTLHTNTPGGDSDFIMRPTSGSMMMAVVFDGATSTIQIQVLPNSTVFATSMTKDDVENMCAFDLNNHISLVAIS